MALIPHFEPTAQHCFNCLRILNIMSISIPFQVRYFWKEKNVIFFHAKYVFRFNDVIKVSKLQTCRCFLIIKFLHFSRLLTRHGHLPISQLCSFASSMQNFGWRQSSCLWGKMYVYFSCQGVKVSADGGGGGGEEGDKHCFIMKFSEDSNMCRGISVLCFMAVVLQLRT